MLPAASPRTPLPQSRGGADVRRYQSNAPKMVNKAGLILHGWVSHDPVTGEAFAEPKHYVVAPWSEGRFSDDGKKLYFLASGSVDEGEHILTAAKREACEETGISLDAIKRGNVAGVRTNLRRGKSYERDIVDLMGRDLRARIYPVELSGIEHLVTAKNADGTPLLKNPEAQIDGGFLPYVHEDSRVENRKPSLPTFDELIDWLRTGVMPAAAWNAGAAYEGTDLGDAAYFQAFEARTMQALIARRAQYTSDEAVLPGGRTPGDMRPMILNPVEFGIWRDSLTAEEQVWVDARTGAIKEIQKSQGILGDDHSPIKLVRNDRFGYCQEGTDILPMSEYLTRIYEGACDNKYYGRSMMNVNDADYFAHGVNHHTINAIAQKQISLLAAALTETDIEDARIPQHAKIALHAVRAHYQKSVSVSR